MNLNDFHYFKSLSEELHFNRAANKLGISQPTLSIQIKKLEEELGIKLFVRDKKQIKLTDQGKDILPKVNSLLLTFNDIKELASSKSDLKKGKLTLGIFPTLAPYFLPKIVPKIHKLFPELKLFLLEDKTEVVEQKLEDGDIDCAILALPITNNTFQRSILFFDEFFLAVSTTNPLSTKKNALLKDLEKENLLLLEDGHCLRDQALSVCSLVKKDIYKEFQATSLETLRHMVATNIGVTLIPRVAVTKLKNVKYLSLEKGKFGREIALVYKKDHHKKTLLKEILKVVLNSN